ncbi:MULTISPECIES: class I SAM-dependent methyltransferase [Bradyrhizobium]|uniref:class I SAM-dependent methyltransferase n=1 Tax=Bradyrhizobium brasilense TaxID=1419277 RepID=UPI001456F63F|nr:class I SAM-dependent methyltransferase [Bradyrhizobium brasilense]NLS67608.1 class I SAM-dependent methyltransferase [Bradyrhizobium brasilense]
MRLTDRESHFEFGENWRSYSKTIDQNRIDQAVEGVRKLFPDGLAGKTFLDIGCGSGLHSLAALSLGAKSVMAIDIDENSVSTTRELLTGRASNSKWEARAISIFNASANELGQFDVVYSWGVLHHTGSMWSAIDSATKFVRPGGQFAIAIYSATTCDDIWKVEKRLYARSPRPVQWIIRQAYMAAFLMARTLRSRESPAAYVRNYSKMRGMNFSHDVHDWLGGYPYETATATELRGRICDMGFTEERSFPLPPTFGLFGSGCHEFVFEKLG